MTAVIYPFPMTMRIGKIRSTAAKMLAKSTDRHAVAYRDQVTVGLWRQMDRAGIPHDERHAQLRAFWSEVRTEMILRIGRGSLPGDGNAA